MKALSSLIHKAVHRRKKLCSVTNALRLVNGKGDGLDGLLVDRYNRHLHVQILDKPWQGRLEDIQQALVAAMPVDYLVVKIRQGLQFEMKELIAGPSQTNYSGINHADLERMLVPGLNGRRVRGIQRVGQDEDFTDSNSFKESYMAGLWVRFL